MITEEPIAAEHDPNGYALIGACLEVYRHMGNGDLEDVYQECLELERRGIPFAPQPKLSVSYKGKSLRKHDEADLLVFDKIIVELKAARTLLPEHEAQLINYLKTTGRRIGYVVNFGAHPKLDWRRRVW
jgi:GxxExxY protein